MNVIAADVWVLTETCQQLSPGDSYHLISHSADAPDRHSTDGECWTAIWTRVPAERVELRADVERTAACRLTDTDTVVIGTVLPWLSDSRQLNVRGAKAFCLRLAEQLTDWQRYRKQANGGLCVLGDFNQDLLTTGHYYGSSEGRVALRAAFGECGLKCLTGATDDPLSGTHGLASIDHIVVGGAIEIPPPRCGVWPAPGTLRSMLSDHYGVWADVEPPATRSPSARG